MPRGGMTPTRTLREPLERLYREFDYGARVERDALQFPLRYADPRDREIVALLTAGLALPVRHRLRARTRRPRVRRLPLPLQPAAGSRRLLRGRARDPPSLRLAREVLHGGRPRRAGPDRPRPRAVRARVPRGGPAPCLPARPPLARLPPPLPAAVRGRPVQAAPPLPALDGPPRAARLRPLDGALAGA